MARTAARQVTPQPNASVTVSQTKVHQGPLPSPEVLRDYDDLIPGAAARIIEMAEHQARHRQNLELVELQANIDARDRQITVEHGRIQGIIWNERIGQLLGAAVAIGCLGGALYCAVMDRSPIAIAAFLSVPVGGIITALQRASSKAKQKDN